MLFRPTQKLAAKIKLGKRAEMPVEQNALADWSANMFLTNRRQYILLSNTQSLYSCILPGVGISSETKFVDAAIQSIEAFMRDDCLGDIFEEFILRSSHQIHFAKALNRSVTGSMNDLIVAAKIYLDMGVDLHEAGCRLNETPLSALRDEEGRKYNNPSRAILLIAPSAESD